MTVVVSCRLRVHYLQRQNTTVCSLSSILVEGRTKYVRMHSADLCSNGRLFGVFARYAKCLFLEPCGPRYECFRQDFSSSYVKRLRVAGMMGRCKVTTRSQRSSKHTTARLIIFTAGATCRCYLNECVLRGHNAKQLVLCDAQEEDLHAVHLVAVTNVVHSRCAPVVSPSCPPASRQPHTYIKHTRNLAASPNCSYLSLTSLEQS